ncbi:Uncharacterised protein [Escherichia coli]|uniref:Uncharacterized protein n=1 Tax=Escherichia coli TaxID=562 RepID=A0A377CFG4_ECOLX|nr:Uncharacterised protein [Escherichia coli]
MNRCSSEPRSGGLQVDHQIAIVQSIISVGYRGATKVILLFTFTWHHADIVTHRRGRPARRHLPTMLLASQPELSLFAQRIFHIGLDADL